MKKRIFALILALVTLMTLSCVSSCATTKAPNIDDVRDRFVYLIEESKSLNVLFFGDGLPVYERDDVLSQRHGIYYEDNLTNYNRVTQNAKYITLDEMKRKAESVYSSEYFNAIYETAFEGVMVGSSAAYIRFYDDGNWIYQSITVTDPNKVFKFSERIYDYSTMKIVVPSDGEYVNLTVDSYTLDDTNIKTVSLSFVFEDGDWYLDSPTY